MREHGHLHTILSINLACDQYLFWTLDFHANFQLRQYHTKTDFTWMEASLREAASEPDKKMTDDSAGIDTPLISLQLPLSKPGNAETLWRQKRTECDKCPRVRGRQAGGGHMRENTEATHRTAAPDVARTYYCDACMSMFSVRT